MGSWQMKMASSCVALIVAFSATVRGKEPEKDIVRTAVEAGSFKTLAAALEAAGLVDALKGDGPFTVFAPTDDAFGKLPSGTVEALLKDVPKLQAILKYHVVPGKVMAADVVKLDSAKTLLGQQVRIDTSDGVKVDAANVVKTDIGCSNGVIHVIDAVLIPMSADRPERARREDDLIAVARGAGQFKTLLAAIDAAGLTDTLRGKGPFTVFAPTDAAFAKLPHGTVESLLKDKDALRSILTYHVVSGRVMARDAVNLTSANSVQGDTIHLTLESNCKSGNRYLKIDDAYVTKFDVTASNGVVHVIDSVITPN